MAADLTNRGQTNSALGARGLDVALAEEPIHV